MNQDSERDNGYYLRKVSDCIRYAEEAEHPALRAYWLELAHRWLQSISLDAQPDRSPGHESTPATVSEAESAPSEASSKDVILPPWSEEQIAAFDDLPPNVRVLAFRELASEAKRSAALAEGEQRETFMKSAGFWQRLANIAEQEIK